MQRRLSELEGRKARDKGKNGEGRKKGEKEKSKKKQGESQRQKQSKKEVRNQRKACRPKNYGTSEPVKGTRKHFRINLETGRRMQGKMKVSRNGSTYQKGRDEKEEKWKIDDIKNFSN